MSGAAGGRKLRFLGDKGVAELRSVKARKAAGLGLMGIESVLDQATPTPTIESNNRYLL